GRKPVMLFGMLLMLVLYFPGFHYITRAGNPALDAASQRTPVAVFAYPGDCTFQLDLTGGAQQFATSCDIAKSALSNAGISYRTTHAPIGTTARVEIGPSIVVESVDATGQSAGEIRGARTAFADRLREALTQAGYPAAAPGAMRDWSVAEVLRVFSEKW